MTAARNRKAFLGKSDKTTPIFAENGSVLLDPATGLPYPDTVYAVKKEVIDHKTFQGMGKEVTVFEPVVSDAMRLDAGMRVVKRQRVSDAGLPLFENGKPVSVYVREEACLLYTSPSPRDATLSRMPSSA